ncbi:UNVERIFIED_CONTAM: hypothetical protein FKN15_059156 [Acipenser sinensis]
MTFHRNTWILQEAKQPGECKHTHPQERYLINSETPHQRRGFMKAARGHWEIVRMPYHKSDTQSRHAHSILPKLFTNLDFVPYHPIHTEVAQYTVLSGAIHNSRNTVGGSCTWRKRGHGRDVLSQSLATRGSVWPPITSTCK